MKEIGSEFWNVPVGIKNVEDSVFGEMYCFLSGRSALSYVIEDIQKKQEFHSALLPSYCCETMIEPFLSHGIEVNFYPVTIDQRGRLKQDIPETHGCDGILLMDYFGYKGEKSQTGANGVVIYDATHSFFTGTMPDADYVYGSMRKWAGFWTGGYAWCVNGDFALPEPNVMDHTYVKLRKRAMEEKEAYIKGDSGDQNKGFLSLFAQASERMTSKSDLCAAERDVELLSQFDITGMKKQRRANAKTLLRYVGEFALFPELEEHDCPLFVPVALPHEIRDRLRKHLIENQIYCPIHWPVSSSHRLTHETERIYMEELSLVCDQRYDEADMERMGQAIAEFLQVEGL